MKKSIIYGSGGVGATLARNLISEGQSVHLAGRNGSALTDLSNELSCSFTVGDVCDSEFFKQVTSEAGENVNSVIYAAGTINLKGLSRLSTDDFIEDYQVNVVGAALAIQASLSSLKKNKGSVVLFSSVASKVGLPMHASIGAAKGAISGLTVSLAAELSPSVRVNAISPSLCETPLGSKVIHNDKIKEALSATHPLKRLGTADDIASLCKFLISDNASWITGQIIGVDGGRGSIASI